MPENLSSIDKSNFENPKRDVKSKVMAENETKSNNFVSSNWFNYLNNYEQFENSVDFNKELAHVTSWNILTNSKCSTDLSYTEDLSKELVRYQITSSLHSTLPNIRTY